MYVRRLLFLFSISFRVWSRHLSFRRDGVLRRNKKHIMTECCPCCCRNTFPGAVIGQTSRSRQRFVVREIYKQVLCRQAAGIGNLRQYVDNSHDKCHDLSAPERGRDDVHHYHSSDRRVSSAPFFPSTAGRHGLFANQAHGIMSYAFHSGNSVSCRIYLVENPPPAACLAWQQEEQNPGSQRN